MRLDAIIQWNMTTTEAEAYKLALCWEDEAQKLVPEEQTTRLPKRGDPRKSYLFKQCWRLNRETKGLIPPEEMKLYIHAQLFTMKAFGGRVDPICLCGEKAWIRWRVWKRKYDLKVAERDCLPPPPSIAKIPQIAKELMLTKKFLYEKCDGEPTKEKIGEFIANGHLKIWVMSGKVSSYYVVLSPWLKPHIETLAKQSYFDPKLAQSKINNDVQMFFRHEFAKEFE